MNERQEDLPRQHTIAAELDKSIEDGGRLIRGYFDVVTPVRGAQNPISHFANLMDRDLEEMIHT